MCPLFDVGTCFQLTTLLTDGDSVCHKASGVAVGRGILLEVQSMRDLPGSSFIKMVGVQKTYFA